jgi:hypothetical protein
MDLYARYEHDDGTPFLEIRSARKSARNRLILLGAASARRKARSTASKSRQGAVDVLALEERTGRKARSTASKSRRLMNFTRTCATLARQPSRRDNPYASGLAVGFLSGTVRGKRRG